MPLWTCLHKSSKTRHAAVVCHRGAAVIWLQCQILPLKISAAPIKIVLIHCLEFYDLKWVSRLRTSTKIASYSTQQNESDETIVLCAGQCEFFRAMVANVAPRDMDADDLVAFWICVVWPKSEWPESQSIKSTESNLNQAKIEYNSAFVSLFITEIVRIVNRCSCFIEYLYPLSSVAAFVMLHLFKSNGICRHQSECANIRTEPKCQTEFNKSISYILTTELNRCVF